MEFMIHQMMKARGIRLRAGNGVWFVHYGHSDTFGKFVEHSRKAAYLRALWCLNVT